MSTDVALPGQLPALGKIEWYFYAIAAQCTKGRRTPAVGDEMRCFRIFIGRAPIVFVWVLLALWNQGCDRAARHKIKTFFFTGVPPLEETVDERGKRPRTSALSAPVEKQRPKIVLYSHTPYVQGVCSKCHQMPDGFRFRWVDHKKGPPVFRKGGGMPGPLLKPKTELCIMCHDDFASGKVKQMSLWLHSPKAEGDCGVCHDPHQSRFPNQLRQKPSKLCRSCHPQCPSLEAYGMNEVDDCLICHNPHIGRDRRMLKRDFREEKHPVKPS